MVLTTLIIALRVALIEDGSDLTEVLFKWFFIQKPLKRARNEAYFYAFWSNHKQIPLIVTVLSAVVRYN